MAVLLVIFDHLGFRGFHGGFIGVDVFFVISGYLITSLLAAEYAEKTTVRHGRGSISIVRFYLRRARRILPAAIAVIAAIVVGSHLLLNSLRVQQVQHDALWAALFGSNINFIRQVSDYFAADLATSSPFNHYWSLAVEEQFYFVWPVLFLMVAGRHGLRICGRRIGWRLRLALALAAIGVGSFAWSVLDTHANPASAYFSTFTRAWELALGGLIGVATTSATTIRTRQATAASLAGVSLLLAGCFVIDTDSAFPGYIALLPTLGAAFLIVAGLTNPSPLPNQLLSAAPMRFVGRISYSLYLWHWPFIVFVAARFPQESGRPSTRAAILALTFVSATVSFYVIERPFRKISIGYGNGRVERFLERHDLQRLGFVVAALVSAAALATLFALARNYGQKTQNVVAISSSDVSLAKSAPRAAPAIGPTVAKRRAPTRGVRVAAYAKLLSRWQAHVRQGLAVGVLPANLQPLQRHLANVATPCNKYRLSIVEHEQECRWGNHNAVQVAAITGASHAGMWLATLKGALDPQTWALYPFSRAWCGWSGGSENVAPKEALQNRDCRALQAQTLVELKRLRVDLLILSESGVRSQQQMLDALSRFASVAKQVVVLGHTPDVLPNFTVCLRGDTDISSCKGRLSESDLSAVALERHAAALFNDPFIDTTPWFCVDLACPPVIDRTPAFTDGSHISAELAPKLIPLLRQSLVQAGAL